jgi:hypothetical protein
MLLRELLQMNEEEELNDKKKKKTKKDPRDKSADKFTTYVGGNTIMNQTCSGDLAGTKKVSTDIRQ